MLGNSSARDDEKWAASSASEQRVAIEQVEHVLRLPAPLPDDEQPRRLSHFQHQPAPDVEEQQVVLPALDRPEDEEGRRAVCLRLLQQPE